MTGLGDFTDRLGRGDYPGVWKQKLGLACTLVQSPESCCCLMNQRWGVDPVSRRELWAIVYRLVQNEGDELSCDNGLSG